MTIVMLVIFTAAMIAVGFWGMKKTASINDFVLGGRNIGPWILALSFGAAYFSAVVFIGFAGKLGWTFGMNVLWIPIGNTLFGAVLAWLVLGRRTRRMTHNLGAMTMPEFFAARYQSKLMKMVAAIVIFIFLAPYSASVFKGLGHLFQSTFDVSYTASVLVITVLTGIYLVMGGYIAASRTDFIQGIIMFIGCIAVTGTLLWKMGDGPIAIIRESIDKYNEHLSTPSAKVMPDSGTKFWLLASLVFMTSFGTWGLPQMVQKFYAIKDEKMITRGAVITGVFSVFVVTSAYFNGTLLHSWIDVVPNGNYDALMPSLFNEFLSEMLMALVLILLLSASMSTLAALVLVSSSAVVVDVLGFHRSTSLKSGTQVNVMRLFTAIFLVLSVVLAMMAERRLQFIVDLMSLSWGTVAGAFMAPYVLGLFWRGVTKAGAMAGMFSGLGIAIGMFLFYDQKLFPISASVAMIVPFVVVPVVSLLTPKLPADVTDAAFLGVDRPAVEGGAGGIEQAPAAK